MVTIEGVDIILVSAIPSSALRMAAKLVPSFVTLPTPSDIPSPISDERLTLTLLVLLVAAPASCITPEPILGKLVAPTYCRSYSHQ